MFKSIFRPEGLVWSMLNTITDVLVLSLLWCTCSLPLLTLGAASTALYDAVAHGIRNAEGGVYRRFFRTFRRELKTSLGTTLLWGGILALYVYVLALLDSLAPGDTKLTLLAGAYRVLMLLPLSAATWSAVLLSRFTFGFRELVITSVRFLPAHLIASAVLGGVTWLCVWFCANYALGLTFVPALMALGWTLPAEAVFQKHGGGLTAPKPEADVPPEPSE